MNIYQKINEIQKKVLSVYKDAEITLGNNSYEVVTHDAVTSALHLPMSEVGLVSIPTIDECQISDFEVSKEWNGKITKSTHYKALIKVTVTFVNSENPEENFKTTIYSYAFDSSDKAVGKAYSMAIKNIYLKTFMLESKDAEEERIIENQSKYKQNGLKNETQNRNYENKNQATPRHQQSINRPEQTPPGGSKTTGNGAQPVQKNDSSPENDNSEPKEVRNESPISVSQASQLYKMLEMKKRSKAQFDDYVKKEFGVESTLSLKVWQYNKLYEMLEAKH